MEQLRPAAPKNDRRRPIEHWDAQKATKGKYVSPEVHLWAYVLAYFPLISLVGKYIIS